MAHDFSLAALIVLAIGCGDGVSGWVLTRNHSSPPGGAGGAGLSNGGGGFGGLALGGAGTSAGRGGSSGAGTGGSATGGAAGEGGAEPNPEDDFAEVCSPVVTIDNRSQAGNGQLFADALPDPAAFMIAAARRSCALLYKLPAEVTVTSDLTVVVEDFTGAPGTLITGGASSTVRLNSLHMRSIADAGGDVALEVSGVSQFLIALDYVNEDEDPAAVGWLNSGLADWVRFRAGYTPLSSRGPGGTWTDGFKTTAFFVDWLDQNYVDAAYLLNQSMNAADGLPWSDQVFVQIGGSDVATLWNTYQASL